MLGFSRWLQQGRVLAWEYSGHATRKFAHCRNTFGRDRTKEGIVRFVCTLHTSECGIRCRRPRYALPLPCLSFTTSIRTYKKKTRIFRFAYGAILARTFPRLRPPRNHSYVFPFADSTRAIVWVCVVLLRPEVEENWICARTALSTGVANHNLARFMHFIFLFTHRFSSSRRCGWSLSCFGFSFFFSFIEFSLHERDTKMSRLATRRSSESYAWLHTWNFDDEFVLAHAMHTLVPAGRVLSLRDQQHNITQRKVK